MIGDDDGGRSAGDQTVHADQGVLQARIHDLRTVINDRILQDRTRDDAVLSNGNIGTDDRILNPRGLMDETGIPEEA